MDKQKNQSEALRKLMGEQNVYVPPASAVVSVGGGGGGSSVSLASFIGGRATGPKLSRHAPQQDAHDPTLFEQRSMADIKTAPHPIFGTRGVAMPGMAKASHKDDDAKERERSVVKEDVVKPWRRERSRERTTSSPAKPIQTAPSARSDSPRMRTESTGASGRFGSSEDASSRPPVAPREAYCPSPAVFTRLRKFCKNIFTINLKFTTKDTSGEPHKPNPNFYVLSPSHLRPPVRHPA